MGIITNSISGSGGGQINFTGSIHMGGNEVLSTDGAIKRLDSAAADNSSLEVFNNQVRVKDAGISNSHINNGAAIAITKLAQRSISGKDLGTNLDALSQGAGISNFSYNGASAVTIAVDESWTRGRVSVTDAGGDGSLSYASATGVITYTGPSSAEARAHVSAAGGTGLAYNSSTGEFSLPQDIQTSASPTFADLTLNGDLTVLGNTVSLQVSELIVEDKTITLASGSANVAAIDGAALIFGQDAAAYQLKWSQASSSPGLKASFMASGSSGYFDIVASKFHGDGSELTNINGGAVSSVAGALNNEGSHLIMTSAGTGTGQLDGESNLTFDGNGLGVTGTITVSGVATFNGNVTLGDATGDDLTFTGRAASDLIPKTNNAYDLGSSTNKFAEIHASEVHAGDLCMRNDRGAWRLIEENDFLTLRNEKTGKRFKFNMTLLPENQWDPDSNWSPSDEE